MDEHLVIKYYSKTQAKSKSRTCGGAEAADDMTQPDSMQALVLRHDCRAGKVLLIPGDN